MVWAFSLRRCTRLALVAVRLAAVSAIALGHSGLNLRLVISFLPRQQHAAAGFADFVLSNHRRVISHEFPAANPALRIAAT